MADSGIDAWEGTTESGPKLSLGLFLKAMWKVRGLVASIVGVFVVLAVVSFSIQPNTYIARAIIAPVANDSAPQGGALQALSAVAGFGSQGNGFDKYLQILQSFRLADVMDRKHHLAKEFYRDSWDEATQQWRPPHGSFAGIKSVVKRLLGRPAWAPPTTASVSRDLHAILGVQTASGTGSIGLAALKNQFTAVSVEYRDPAKALQILNWALMDADELARQDRLQNTANRVAYLEHAIQVTTDLVLRESLQRILEDQERTLMTLKADRYFSIDVVDPPVVDMNPASSIILSIFWAAIFGLGVAAVFVYLFLYVAVRRARKFGGDPLVDPLSNPVDAIRHRFRRDRY